MPVTSTARSRQRFGIDDRQKLVMFLVMKMVNIAEAKAHFSEHVAAAEKGAEVVVCRHNKPVAKIVRFETKLSKKKWKRGASFGSLTNVIKITGDWDGVESPLSLEEVDALGRKL
jgi:prevent-host-death family protein